MFHALRRGRWLLPSMLALCLLVQLASGRTADAVTMTFTVNISTDGDDGACQPLTILNPGQDCTLREAIEAANANPGFDRIEFGGFGIGTHTISGSELPAITETVTIDATGSIARPAITQSGLPSGADGLTIANGVGGVVIRGLAIYGFPDDGIEINGSNNHVYNNYIGLNAAGTAAGPGNKNGVKITGINGATGDTNTIGGLVPGDRNLISGNVDYGIWIQSGSDNNKVQGNYIGLNAAGTAAIPNGYGVQMHGGTGNITGGTTGTTPGSCTGACNVISGNSTGIRIDAASNQSVVGNFIGTNPAGTAAIPNLVGISVQGDNNVIGGDTANERNIVSGNTEDGIRVLADGNAVSGNYVGLNAAGTAGVANGTGISMGHPNELREAHDNVIGGLSTGERNIISGNADNGIALYSRSDTNAIVGNFVGTDPAGTTAIPNVTGVLVGSDDNAVGGVAVEARNVISGNNSAGVRVTGAATMNEIFGNYIGTTPAGDSVLGNGDGVLLEAAGNIIGGTQGVSPGGLCSGACNLMSGNGTGVHLTGPEAANNDVHGNVIGGNADGDAPLPNSFFGVRFSAGAHDNNLGGLTPEQRNMISGNGTGIRMGDPTTTGNLIRGNYLGTNAAGDDALGNINEGVYISNAAGNTIGGDAAGAGNVIAHNGAGNPDASGVRVQDADALGNRVWGNSIYANANLGIQLDAGGNNDQEAPVLSSAENGSTHVIGALDSGPNVAYRIEFFANPACDASGSGEGQTYLGFSDVTTNGAGHADIDATLAATAAAGEQVTATATDPDGNTSEFSGCVEVTGSTTPTPTPSPTPPGQTPTPTPTATPPGQTPTATPSKTPKPTASPGGIQGDVTCDNDVTSVDSLFLLREVAGLGAGACAENGDVNCDGDRTSVDALGVLRHVAGLPVNQNEPCADIGTEV